MALNKCLDIIKYVSIIVITTTISGFVTMRMMDIAGVRNSAISLSEMSYRISNIEQNMETNHTTDATESRTHCSLYGKKIVYDGDSIAQSREENGGGYASLIAQLSESTFENHAIGGARLCSSDQKHSVVDNLVNLPEDGDLYCFEGGINDYWANTPIGNCDPQDYSGELDTTTICGAMETIFRYCSENFQGKPVCFVIVHKVQKTAVSQNKNGDTFADYRDAMIAVCQKYSIPYYDAFNESGLNGWNHLQSELYLTANGQADGTHPNEEGYKRYYVPQLLDLFERIIPAD